MREFIEINDFYPDILVSENYIVYKQILTEDHLELCHDNVGELYKDKVKIGKEYLFLLHQNLQKTMMSNHESETITNQKFIDYALGDVLIFGLGLGLIIFPLLKDKHINRIVVVEVDEGLIEIISPIILKHDIYSKVEIINGDAFNWVTDEKFDTIYFDIWHTIDGKSFKEMNELSEKFISNLKPDGWMDSWCSELIKNKNYESK